MYLFLRSWCSFWGKSWAEERSIEFPPRNLLQDIKSQKPVLDDLLERSQQLPEVSEYTQSFIATSQNSHSDLQLKAQTFVETYEAIVANHQQYMKAVMELSEWMTATHNTIEMWSDTSLERDHSHMTSALFLDILSTIDVRGFPRRIFPIFLGCEIFHPAVGQTFL